MTKMVMEENLLAKRNKKKKLVAEIGRNKYFLIMLFPWMVYYFIFQYIPAIGTVIAFKDYNIYKGILESPWVGFYYFRVLFNDPNFFRLLRNTFLLSVYGIVFGTIASITLAVLLNEVYSPLFKRTVQTITYLPHFISNTVIAGIVIMVLSPKDGLVNQILVNIFNSEPIYFMGDPKYFRAIYTITGLWQGVGWGTIVYLAAITGIDPQLYEACMIDGGGRIRQFWNITLPGMMPTIVLLLILNVAKVLDVGTEKVLLMYNPLIYETADVFGTYTYRVGLMGGQFSLGTAVSLFNSVVGLILMIITNYIARRLTETSLW